MFFVIIFWCVEMRNLVENNGKSRAVAKENTFYIDELTKYNHKEPNTYVRNARLSDTKYA